MADGRDDLFMDLVHSFTLINSHLGFPLLINKKRNKSRLLDQNSISSGTRGRMKMFFLYIPCTVVFYLSEFFQAVQLLILLLSEQS